MDAERAVQEKRHQLERAALDARTGKLLWQTNLGVSVAAGPVTYAVNGRQFVSIMAGTSLFTFGLRDP